MSDKAPPYPADTRAKGWRFELNYEQIDQSDTWAIASEIPLAQHCLLMMWYVAWKQEPCGSFPSDEVVIRAKCKLSPKVWGSVRDVLMRGWWKAEDGRLYHPTLTQRVLEMLEYRRKTAERVAAFKLKQREKRDGNALPTCEQQVKNDTGTGTGTGTKEISKTTSSHPRKRGEPQGLRFEEFWLSWPKHERKQDRAKCWDHWRRNDLDALTDTILADVRTKRGTTKWQDGFIEAPLVYLRGRRWEDGVEPASVTVETLAGDL